MKIVIIVIINIDYVIISTRNCSWTSVLSRFITFRHTIRGHIPSSFGKHPFSSRWRRSNRNTRNRFEVRFPCHLSSTRSSPVRMPYRTVRFDYSRFSNRTVQFDNKCISLTCTFILKFLRNLNHSCSFQFGTMSQVCKFTYLHIWKFFFFFDLSSSPQTNKPLNRRIIHSDGEFFVFY